MTLGKGMTASQKGHPLWDSIREIDEENRGGDKGVEGDSTSDVDASIQDRKDTGEDRSFHGDLETVIDTGEDW